MSCDSQLPTNYECRYYNKRIVKRFQQPVVLFFILKDLICVSKNAECLKIDDSRIYEAIYTLKNSNKFLIC